MIETVKESNNRTRFIQDIIKAIDKQDFITEETKNAPYWINKLSYGSYGFCISTEQDVRILDMALVPGKPIKDYDFQKEHLSTKVDVALKLFDVLKYLDEMGYTHGNIEKGNNILFDPFKKIVSLIDFQFLTDVEQAPEFVTNDLRQIIYVLKEYVFSNELQMLSRGEGDEAIHQIKAFLDNFPDNHSVAEEGYQFFKEIQHKLMHHEHSLVLVRG